MSKYFTFLILLVLTTVTHSQDNAAPSIVLPDGVRLPVVLIEDFVQEHVGVNDSVRLRVAKNLLGPDRTVVIPEDAVAIARVVENQLPKKKNPARLLLIIEKVQWKNGSLPLHAYIVPPLRPPQSQKVDPKTSVFQRDVLFVGFETHEPAGVTLYSKYSIHLPSGTSFMLEQTSKPGVSAEPPVKD